MPSTSMAIYHIWYAYTLGFLFQFFKPLGISINIVVSLLLVKHVNIGQHKKSSNFSLRLKCCILRASLLYNIVLWLAIFDNISNAPLRCIYVHTQLNSVIYNCYMLTFIKCKSKLFMISLVCVFIYLYLVRIDIKRHNIIFQMICKIIYLRWYVNKNAETMLQV